MDVFEAADELGATQLDQAALKHLDGEAEHDEDDDDDDDERYADEYASNGSDDEASWHGGAPSAAHGAAVGEAASETVSSQADTADETLLADCEAKRTYGRMAVNTHKAGMQGVDRARVNEIVHELSKDSSFYKNEQRKDEKTEKRIVEMKARWAMLHKSDLSAAQLDLDAEMARIESQRQLDETWAHVDMDSFFASVEELLNPSLRGKAFGVGGMGMLSTSSYEARKYGVRAAMPGWIAKKLCPHLILVSSGFEHYKKASDKVRAVLRRFDPKFRPLSLDEAYDPYLHLTPYMKRNGVSAAAAVRQLRAEITEASQLTASVGIGPNTMIAKICSDRNKPNGQFEVAPTRQAVLEFLHPLSVRLVPGIGKVSEKMLNAFGIMTVGDLYRNRLLVKLLFHPKSAQHLLRVSLGVGSAHVIAFATRSKRKSLSTERTFRAVTSIDALMPILDKICTRLAREMREESLRAGILTIKCKNVDFEVNQFTHSIERGEEPIQGDYDRILDLSLQLLHNNPVRWPLRLFGVRVSRFVDDTEHSDYAVRHAAKPINAYFAPPSPAAATHADTAAATDATAVTDAIARDELSSGNVGGLSSSVARSSPRPPVVSMLQRSAQAPTSSSRTTTRTTVVSSEFMCPVCEQVFPSGNSIFINQHVDYCLEKRHAEETAAAAAPSLPSTQSAVMRREKKRQRRSVDNTRSIRSFFSATSPR